MTARRRVENAQDVPISAQGFSGEAIQSRGMDTAAELTRLVPGLSFAGSYETVPKITIRGVGTNEFAANVNPAVGLYVDEVYQGLATGQNFQLFDLERVEVLRGPQGTLFGKNSTGGAIQYFTRNPTADFEGRIEAGTGSFGLFETEAMLNIPVDEGIGLRVSGVVRKRGGYWKNLFLGTKDGDYDRWGLRAKLRIEPSATSEIVLKVAAGEADDDLRRSRQVGTLPSGADLTGYVAPKTFWQGDSNLRTYDKLKTLNIALMGKVDFGAVTLTSVTGYDRVRRNALEDIDESPFELARSTYPSFGKSFSQELRLSGEAGPVQYVVGGFYGRERHRNGISARLFECFAAATCAVPTGAADLRAIAGAFGIPTDGLPDDVVEAVFPDLLNGALSTFATGYDVRYRMTTNTLAGFAEATVELGGGVNLTGGLRYTSEKRSINGTSLATGAAILGPGFGFDGLPAAIDSKRWTDLSGRVILDYRPSDDVLLYASASRAFRAGNYNGVAFGARELVVPPVNPETLLSYEIGAKTDLFDRRLRLNVAAFYSKFDDKQEFVILNLQPFLRNATAARIYGFEADLAWTPSRHWQLTSGLALLDAKYGQFVTDVGDFSGNRLVNAPKLSANASITYTTPVRNNMDAFIGFDLQHKSRVFYQTNNLPLAGAKSHTIGNMRFGVSSEGKGISVTGYVNNLFNTKTVVDSNDLGPPFFITVLTENMPRSWGLSLAYRF
ncbi:TonB-dependent receptor [Sphingopyxis sp.]|uniref:TonB-dependent receptor n=1 Tax=Sphingopyxis sp. TaxID=1908224 RepID=UPI003D6D351F